VLQMEAELNQWARWQLRIVGQTSGAVWRTYGAGTHVRVAWHGLADVGVFVNEQVHVEIGASSVSGQRLAQKEAYVVQLINPPSIANQYAVHLLKNKTIFAWGKAQLNPAQSKRASAMQLQFNGVPSGIVMRLAGKRSIDLDAALFGTVLTMDIRLDQHGAEGLRIGLQDKQKHKVHVDAAAYIHPDTAAGQWQRIHIPLTDFVKRAQLRQRAQPFNWQQVRKLSLSTSHAPYIMQIDRVQLQRWNFSQQFYSIVSDELGIH